MKKHIVHVGCQDLTKAQIEEHLTKVKKAFEGFFTQPAVYMPNRETKLLYVETVEMD